MGNYMGNYKWVRNYNENHIKIMDNGNYMGSYNGNYNWVRNYNGNYMETMDNGKLYGKITFDILKSDKERL